MSNIATRYVFFLSHTQARIWGRCEFRLCCQQQNLAECFGAPQCCHCHESCVFASVTRSGLRRKTLPLIIHSRAVTLPSRPTDLSSKTLFCTLPLTRAVTAKLRNDSPLPVPARVPHPHDLAISARVSIVSFLSRKYIPTSVTGAVIGFAYRKIPRHVFQFYVFVRSIDKDIENERAPNRFVCL